MLLQQCLPFTVLKLERCIVMILQSEVATVLTVYGIETSSKQRSAGASDKVATVLTVYGIETDIQHAKLSAKVRYSCNSAYRLRY